MKRLLVCILLVGLAGFGLGEASAQDLKSILSGVAKVVGNKVTEKSNSIEGTWTFVGPDCKFESDNLLAKAGGEVAAKKVEDKMSGILSTLGFKEGTTYTFNADSTYTCQLGSRTTSGTYEVNDATLSLKKLNFTTLKTNAKVSGSELQLAVQADKILTLVSSLSNLSGSNSMLSTVTNFMKGYDGMQVGVKFKKE